MRRLFLIITFMGLLNAPLFCHQSFAQEQKTQTNKIYFYNEDDIIKYVFLSKHSVLRGASYSQPKPHTMYATREIGKDQFRMFELSPTSCERYGYNCTGLKICIEPSLDIDRSELSKIKKKYNFEKNKIVFSVGVDYKLIDGKNRLVAQSFSLCKTIDMKNGLTEKEINKPVLEFTNMAEEVLKISYPFKGDKIME